MKKENIARFSPVLLIVLPSALAFLLLAEKFGFYTDDWYSIYAVAARGVQVFWQIFSFDRPARAILMIPLYDLFGAHAPLYSYSGYAVRLLGALVFTWMLARVWPGRRWMVALAGLFYLIYPGFLDQPKAFDFQSHLWSISAALVSIAFSVRAQLPGLKTWQRPGLLFSSMLLTFFYLSQMEYFIGLEGLRFLLTAFVLLRAQSALRWNNPRAWKGVMLGWLPAVLPVVVFLAWRVLFFQGARSDTDLVRIFAQLGSSPLRSAWLGVRLLQDVFNTLISAWVIPLYQLTMSMRLREVLATIGIGILAAGMTAVFLKAQMQVEGAQERSSSAPAQMAWIGLAAAVIALIPAELGGRRIEFIEQTRYSLPVSAGVGLLVAGLLAGLSGKRRILFAAALLCGIGVSTHYANSQYHANQWQSARAFWWQLSWRAPQIKPGTTLLAEYPNMSMPLEYVVWGPANLIYYPQFIPDAGAPLALSALVPAPNELQGLVMKSLRGSDEKGILTVKDAQRLLVLWMPEVGCLKAIDGQNPELSENLNKAVYLSAGYSRQDSIDVSSAAHVPASSIFGPEPAHSWCYYYQKASLARQRGDWAETARLGDQALASAPDTADWVEFFPFIQAYANQDELDKADNLARLVVFKPWLREQACQNFSRTPVPSSSGQTYLVNKFCH